MAYIDKAGMKGREWSYITFKDADLVSNADRASTCFASLRNVRPTDGSVTVATVN